MAQEGYSPEEIAEQLERPAKELLPKIYAALAYYHANKDEMEADILSENAAYEKYRLAEEISWYSLAIGVKNHV